MSDLTFWNKAASSQMRTIMANTISIEIDNIFTMIRGAVYEKGRTKDMAIADMLAILQKDDKTLTDLAEANDKNYLFWQEANIAGSIVGSTGGK
jgi:hypothetical protein